MKSLLYTLYSFFIILTQTQFSVGQKTEINLNNITETVDIHTDRDLYFNSEIVYYSIDYLINKTKSSGQLSNIVYVELINCNNKSIIYQEKIRIEDFKASGSILIPKDVWSGNYLLRAYTQYQRNSSEYGFGYHFISIINPTEENPQFNTLSQSDSIQIIAESNILLEGIENRVVFYIPEQLYNTTNKYFITDNTYQIIKEITSVQKNYFQDFIHLKKDKYFLQVITPDGKSHYKKFPEILADGIQTNTEFLSDYIQYKIHLKKETDSQNKRYQLNVLSNGFILKHTEEIKINSPVAIRNISTQHLDYGINYLALLDEAGSILKINSVYKPIPYSENISIDLEKEIFTARENIIVKINSDNQGNNEINKVSVSVTMDGVSKDDHCLNLPNYATNALVLEDFLQNKNLPNEDIGRLMIFLDQNVDYSVVYEKLFKQKANTLNYLPETRDLTLTGILRNKKDASPISGQNVYISALFNNPQLHIYKTRENGEFIFSLNNLSGVNDVFLCTDLKSNESTEPEILIKNSFSTDIPDIGLITVFVDILDKDLIEKAYINSQIQNHFYKKELKEVHKRIKSDQFNIGGEKITKYLDNYVKMENMEVVITEIFPNIKYGKSKGEYTLNISDENGFYLSGTPLVLIDYVPVFDYNAIMQLDVSLIEKIDVVYKTYVLGDNIIQGLIHITTKTDNFAGIKLAESGTFMEYQTVNKYNLTVEPFNTNELSENLPDFRTTLYWNPDFKVTDNNKISFYSSDRKGKYNIIVKGHNSKGELVYSKKQLIIE